MERQRRLPRGRVIKVRLEYPSQASPSRINELNEAGTKRKGVQDAPRVIADTEASPSDLTAQYKAAVVRGEVPDTPLAEEVYTNWKRFPDAILLTRVGKFYEVGSSKALPY